MHWCAGVSVSHHLLAAYTSSLLAVLVGQYSSKRFKGGMAGVVRLAEHSVPVQVCVMHILISWAAGGDGATACDMIRLGRQGQKTGKHARARM